MMRIERALRTLRGKVFIAAVAAAGLLLGIQHFAYAYTPQREQDRVQVDCVRTARLLMTIAQARSEGMPKQTLMDASREPAYRSAISRVYSVELGNSPEETHAAINKFALDELAACLKASK